jgi:ABC-type glutathione transport system ATPase component
MKNPDILVLDEPTSGLDPGTETRILGTVLEWARGRTVVWALGRADLARAFDRVLVLEEGRLVEQGTFAELERPGTAASCSGRPSPQARPPVRRQPAAPRAPGRARLPRHGAAAVYEATPDNTPNAGRCAGDSLSSPPDYRDGLPAGLPANRPGRSPSLTGAAAATSSRGGANTISIVDSRHLVIRHLVLEGSNLPVDAVKAEKQSRSAHHITLENMVIRGHGPVSRPSDLDQVSGVELDLRGNTIIGAGTGMYLGDSDGSAPFVAGLIERNLVVDATARLRSASEFPRRDSGMKRGRARRSANVFAKADSVTASAAPQCARRSFPAHGSRL